MTKHQGHYALYTLLKNQQETNITSEFEPIMHSSNSDFPIAVAVLAVMAVALLLASYYIFVIKCCLNWQNLDPLRRFSISRARRIDDPLMSFSPMVDIHRGLDEWLINNIPAIQYKGEQNNNLGPNSRSFRGCAVCLNEFQEQEMLRVLPRCTHTFHLDCIDVWLLNNASCPLCRSSISGRTRYPIDQIIAPSSSPQEIFSPFSGSLSININGDDQDYLVIELGEEANGRSVSRELTQRITEQNKGVYINNVIRSCKKGRNLQNLSIKGDECIGIRQKDDQFAIQQPIRRSFSMDSAADRGLYLQVQEILRQNNRRVHVSNEVSSTSINEECNSNNGRVRRSSFFSFGHGRGSRSSSSILPIECDR